MTETPAFDAKRPMESIYAFLEAWPDAEFGPAHIVLADSNLEDEHIRWCLGLCRAALSHDERDLMSPYEMGDFVDFSSGTIHQKECGDKHFMDRMNWYDDCDRDELSATATFLEQLLMIPESTRLADIDGEDN